VRGSTSRRRRASKTSSVFASASLPYALKRPRLMVLAGYVGEKIRNHTNRAHCSVSKCSQVLQKVEGAKGDATRTSHGTFLAAQGHSNRQAGIKFYGGGRNKRSCEQPFSHLMQTFKGAVQGLAQRMLILYYGWPEVARGQGDMKLRGDREVGVEPCRCCGC
jgi:hypothetical protein